MKWNKDAVIIDLPGIYSLSPYTLEEVVARNYLIGERPDAILNIVDGTNLERNLYLSTQLMELGIPVVMAVNMMDVVKKSGDRIHIQELSRKLGCQVVEISALRGTGTVSYTHLNPENHINDKCPPFLFLHGTQAVSYTHLDVYKRQLFNTLCRVDMLLYADRRIKAGDYA